METTTTDTTPKPVPKLKRLTALVKRKRGATLSELMAATGWQAHSVRGAISGNLRKKLGLTVVLEEIEGRGRVYRIVSGV